MQATSGTDVESSRERLLSAARTVLGERGYDAATVREISTAAGAPQGLIHYYFGGKDRLLAEVLKGEALAYRAEQQRLAARVPRPGAAAKAALERRRQRVSKDPAWHRLRYELFALGLRNRSMASPLRELLTIGRDSIKGLLDRAPKGRVRSTTALAAVVLACTDGLALQKLADPKFDLDSAYQALEEMLSEVFK